MVEDVTSAARPPLGTRYAVSSGQMLLHRSGTGTPPVVFLPGGGMFGLYYWNAHRLVAECTTSVLYDRLGLGWSDAADLPRSGAQVTDDLRELLRTAAVPGPHVLVGHSLGGLHARLHAKRFPDEVAGLVLLDPTHEDVLAYLPAKQAQQLGEYDADALPAPQREAMRTAYRTAFDRGLADWPDEIREPLLARAFGGEGFRQSLREPMNVSHLFGEVRDAGPDPDVPQIFLSAMGSDAFTAELIPPEARASAAEVGRAKHQLYTDVSAASPRAEVRRLDDVGHSGLATHRPDAVAQAVRDVLAR